MQKKLNSKDEVKQAFNALLAERTFQRGKIATKEETAREAKKKEMVAVASAYTPGSIVKGAAELQLEFGDKVESLIDKLKTELKKVDELRSAIAVEHDNLKESNNTKIAANALFILKKEQERQLQEFEEAAAEKLKDLETEMTETRDEWKKADEAFELQVKDYTEGLEKERQQDMERYKYELDRKYKVEKDQFEQKKKLLIRSLEEKLQGMEKDWAAREKVLAENQEDYDKYKEAVDNFDAKKEEEIKKAKDKAMKKASREVKVAADLQAKEMEGAEQVATLQISDLEGTISEQKEQIEQLNAELKEALGRLQDLSSKALEN